MRLCQRSMAGDESKLSRKNPLLNFFLKHLVFRGKTIVHKIVYTSEMENVSLVMNKSGLCLALTDTR